MDFPNTIDSEVILGIQALAIIFALSVFWPRQGRKRHYFSRVVTLFMATGLFAGLIVVDPSQFIEDDRAEVSLIAWVTCEEGQAPWCIDVIKSAHPEESPEQSKPLKAASTS